MRASRFLTVLRNLRMSFSAIAASAVLLISFNPAVASASAYHCGSQCNGKASTWVIPANGIQCSHSAVVVSHGYLHEVGTSPAQLDKAVVATVYYSTTCQTMWLRAEVVGPYTAYLDCQLAEYRWLSPSYYHHAAATCPAKSSSITTPMVDDYSPSGSTAARVRVYMTAVYSGALVTETYYLNY